MAKHKILLVDDHPVFREGLVRLLNQEKDLQVVAESETAENALKAVGSYKPELVIIDISLEGTSGIDLARTLRSQSSSIRLLILSLHKESLYAERALRAGANGYIMKRESSERVLEAVRQVLRGQTFVSDTIKEVLLQKLSSSSQREAKSPMELLSEREFEIFEFIGEGYGTRQIADKLHLSIKTVESHREHIRDKMHLLNTFELVQKAIHWIHAERGAV